MGFWRTPIAFLRGSGGSLWGHYRVLGVPYRNPMRFFIRTLWGPYWVLGAPSGVLEGPYEVPIGF